MIEITEAIPLSIQAEKLLKGKTVTACSVMSSPHKFCWMNLIPEEVSVRLIGATVSGAKNSASYIRLLFGSGQELAIGEDVKITYSDKLIDSNKNQLVLSFDDGSQLELKTGLYGFMLVGSESELQETQTYYRIALNAVSPLDERYSYDMFLSNTGLSKGSGSIKQALATEQRIPGLGNGILQDILFNAGIRPTKKVVSLSEDQKKGLFESVRKTISEVASKGGRDSVKDFFGNPGGYTTKMASGRDKCPVCGTSLTKKAYLGGKVIFCPKCQAD